MNPAQRIRLASERASANCANVAAAAARASVDSTPQSKRALTVSVRVLQRTVADMVRILESTIS